jgi:hypothetical protein
MKMLNQATSMRRTFTTCGRLNPEIESLVTTEYNTGKPQGSNHQT